METAFDGQLVMPTHHPNWGQPPRMRLFVLEDMGETLSIKNEILLK